MLADKLQEVEMAMAFMLYITAWLSVMCTTVAVNIGKNPQGRNRTYRFVPGALGDFLSINPTQRLRYGLASSGLIVAVTGLALVAVLFGPSGAIENIKALREVNPVLAFSVTMALVLPMPTPFIAMFGIWRIRINPVPIRKIVNGIQIPMPQSPSLVFV